MIFVGKNEIYNEQLALCNIRLEVTLDMYFSVVSNTHSDLVNKMLKTHYTECLV